MFDSVGKINMTGITFDGCTSSVGAGMACIGVTTPVTMLDIFFYNSKSTSMSEQYIDVYSDGSCTDPFWYSASECPVPLSCNSCGVCNFINIYSIVLIICIGYFYLWNSSNWIQ